MAKTEGDPLGPDFEHRLRSELDRVQPRSTAPRYATALPRVGGWRFAPVALVISLAGMVALTAFVTTGSTNPVVWTERVVTTLHSEPTPSPSNEEQRPAAAPPAVAPSRAPVRSTSSAPPPENETQPTSSAHESESPEPSESPGESPEPFESPRPSPFGTPSPEY